jgi:hypothetical protein
VQPARGIGGHAKTASIRAIVASLCRLVSSHRRRRGDAVGRRRRAILARAARRDAPPLNPV